MISVYLLLDCYSFQRHNLVLIDYDCEKAPLYLILTAVRQISSSIGDGKSVIYLYENLSIIISAQPNTAKDERKCTLTVKDNGNALTLHVIQAAAANDNTEPGYNNSTSTKPALSPIK